jgi:Zn-dependent M28 family amino/carboxypeptidase
MMQVRPTFAIILSLAACGPRASEDDSSSTDSATDRRVVESPRIEGAPPAEFALLHELVPQVSAARLEADVRTLVGFGTRHTLSDTVSETRGIGAARRWIRAELEAISANCGGCLEVIEVAEAVAGEERIPEPAEVINVVAIQRGTLDPDRVVLMTAHYDSRVNDVMDAVTDAPGANDNASGTAAVLEAARVLSRYELAGTIVYAALAGEEQGLVGGAIVAAHAQAEGWRVKAVLNNDMIGNIEGGDGRIGNTTARVFSEGVRAATAQPETSAPDGPAHAMERYVQRLVDGELDSPARNLARYVDRIADGYVANLDVVLVYRFDRHRRASDHIPFSELGMPAVRLMEAHENFARQHQVVRLEDGVDYGDVIEGVDFAYAAKLTALNVAAIAGLASAPPFPAGVAITGGVSPSTTLRWTRPDGPEAGDLAGYRLYWRATTEPQWTHSRYAGDVTEFTLTNVSIDDHFFGVASVAGNGAESPAVFPGPVGSFGE